MRPDHVGPADRGHWKPHLSRRTKSHFQESPDKQMRAAALSQLSLRRPLSALAECLTGDRRRYAGGATSATRRLLPPLSQTPAPKSASCPFPWAESTSPQAFSRLWSVESRVLFPLPSQHTQYEQDSLAHMKAGSQEEQVCACCRGQEGFWSPATVKSMVSAVLLDVISESRPY